MLKEFGLLAALATCGFLLPVSAAQPTADTSCVVSTPPVGTAEDPFLIPDDFDAPAQLPGTIGGLNQLLKAAPLENAKNVPQALRTLSAEGGPTITPGGLNQALRECRN